jgi:hypothetical protein
MEFVKKGGKKISSITTDKTERRNEITICDVTPTKKIFDTTINNFISR